MMLTDLLHALARVARHDCATCTDCIHEGHKCCGCYDGMCCHEGAHRHVWTYRTSITGWTLARCECGAEDLA